jgi:hypothetical protein
MPDSRRSITVEAATTFANESGARSNQVINHKGSPSDGARAERRSVGGDDGHSPVKPTQSAQPAGWHIRGSHMAYPQPDPTR